MREIRESDIEQYAVNRIRELGGEVRKVKWIGRNGAPDRRVMLPWRCCWVEFKAPGESLEAHQEREHRRMRWCGEDVIVIDSFDGVHALITRP